MSFNFINLMNAVLLALILLPNLIWARRNPGAENHCINLAMNILEQTGRYGCMIFIILPLGAGEFGFHSVEAFILYLLVNVVLLIAYLLIWSFLFHRAARWKSMALSVIPVLLFLFCGVLLRQVPLIVSALLLGASHPYITWKNVK